MRHWWAVSAIALGLSPLVAAAQEVERGRTLYETYCFDCHYPRVHERPRGKSEV